MHLVLLLLLPGFVYFKASKTDKALRPKEQWSYVLDISLKSISYLILTRGLIWVFCVYLSRFYDENIYLPFLRELWHKIAPFEYSFTLIAACFFALIGGLYQIDRFSFVEFARIAIKNLGINPGRQIGGWLQRTRRPQDAIDPYYSQLAYLSQKEREAFIEIKDGKVYIGDILEATLDMEVQEKVIVIAPYFSGRRNEEKGKLIINTYYNLGQSESGKEVKITIPFREITSLREFDRNFFTDCVMRGWVSIERFEEIDKKEPTSPKEESN